MRSSPAPSRGGGTSSCPGRSAPTRPGRCVRVDRFDARGDPRADGVLTAGEVIGVVRVQALDTGARPGHAAPVARLQGSPAPCPGRRRACAASTAAANAASSRTRSLKVVIHPSDSTRATALTVVGQVSQKVVGNGRPLTSSGALRITSGWPPVHRHTTTNGVLGSRPSWSRTAVTSAARSSRCVVRARRSIASCCQEVRLTFGLEAPRGCRPATSACARPRACSRPGALRSAS